MTYRVLTLLMLGCIWATACVCVYVGPPNSSHSVHS
uniref:Uncharacterized protein n=1 Tax=Anguilla anguilla TaxID=7936 RepID=A0A0E9SR45_ANGAN